MPRSVSASTTFSISKPNRSCNERTNPRTATREDVTSTAQIAICTTSSTSRVLIFFPPLVLVPAFTTSYGLVRSTCLTGTAPNSSPLNSASSTATTYTCPSGFTARWRAVKLGNGCHALSARSSATLPNNPIAPPPSEIRNASVNSPRKIRFLLDPSASRKATSRDRSAARAANRLPRFAHAANRIRPVNNIRPAINAFSGLRRRHAWLEMADRLKDPMVAARIQVVSSQQRVFHQRHKKSGIEKQKRSAEFAWTDAKNRERMLVHLH